MAARIQWRVLKNDFGKLAGGAVRVKQAANKQAAEGILADAQVRVHVLSGDLKASGRAEDAGNGDYRVTFGDGLPDPRAVVEELGSAKIGHAPHPYLTPAAEAARSKHAGLLAAALARLLGA